MPRIVNSAASAGSTASSRLMAKLSCGSPVGGRGAGREEAIRQAVVELLNETSYESVTMDAVAARAKASKATIYRRWANKDELVLEALRGMIGGRQLVPVDTGNLRDDIMTWIGQQMQDPVLAAVNTAALKVLVYAASSEPVLAGQLRETFRDSQLLAWQTLLHWAFARGELQNEVDAALMFEVVQGQFCARTGVDAGSVDMAYVEHLVDNVMMPVILHAGSAAARAPGPPAVHT